MNLQQVIKRQATITIFFVSFLFSIVYADDNAISQQSLQLTPVNASVPQAQNNQYS